MNTVEVTIHDVGSGPCSLTGKDGDGLRVTFGDGTVTNAFLSWKAFRQLLGLKLNQGPQVSKPRKDVAPLAQPANGEQK
jgi:hypothetical protein